MLPDHFLALRNMNAVNFIAGNIRLHPVIGLVQVIDGITEAFRQGLQFFRSQVAGAGQ